MAGPIASVRQPSAEPNTGADRYTRLPAPCANASTKQHTSHSVEAFGLEAVVSIVVEKRPPE